MDDIDEDVGVPGRKTAREWYRRNKYAMKEALHRLMSRASFKIDYFHWKSAKYLQDNFDVVYIPKFQAQKTISEVIFCGKYKEEDVVHDTLELYAFGRKLLY